MRAGRPSTPPGQCVVPGFIDAHMHLESVKLLVDEFARLVLPLGTTAIVADPHEIANVLGVDGVHWLLDASSGLQLDVYFMAPSCVPASPFESPRRASRARRSRVADAPPPRARPRGDDELPRRRQRLACDELAKLALDGAAHVDGHAPGLLGKELQAYAAAGIRSDHEALTAEEGRERLRAGMWLLIREASMARNLRALLPLVLEYGPGRIAFCTDDRDPEDIADNGHINGMVRDAVAAGVTPEDALVMASLPSGAVARPRPARGDRPGLPGRPASPARPRQLRSGHGAEARPADRGRPVRRRCRTGSARRARPSARRASDFAIPSSGARIRAIGLVDDQVVTESVDLRSRRRGRARRRRPRAPTWPRSPSSSATSQQVASASGSSPRSGLRARGARVVGGARRAQPRRRRDERRGHAPAVAHLADIGGGIVASTTAGSSRSALCPLPAFSRMPHSQP